MIEVVPFLFGIALDVRAPNQRPFSQSRMEQLLTRLVEIERGLALKADQIRLRNIDNAFDYELKASLLGANGVFISDAEKSHVSISGGRTPTDARVLWETARRFLWTIDAAPEDVVALSVNTHARATSQDARSAFLHSFSNDKRLSAPGGLGYVKFPTWTQDVRFSVEQSVGVSDSLFMAWSTQIPAAGWPNSVEDLTKMLELVAEVFAVKFKPMEET